MGGRAATRKPCAFCEIVAGRAPAHLVHADADVVAFLDTSPLFLGHVLLVPTVHVTRLRDLPPDRVATFARWAQALETAVEEAAGADGSLVLVNNVVSQSVPHLHLHVIPRRRGDGLRRWLGPRQRYASEDAAAATAAAIAAAMPADRPATVPRGEGREP